MTATEKPLAILFYMFVVQLLIGLAPALPGLVVPELERWPWVISIGVSGLAAHYCVARAFMAADASVVIPIDFLRLPAIGLAAWLLYGESGEIWHIGWGRAHSVGHLDQHPVALRSEIEQGIVCVRAERPRGRARNARSNMNKAATTNSCRTK